MRLLDYWPIPGVNYENNDIDFCLFLLGHSVTHDSNGKSIKKDRFATPATADTNLTAKMNSRKSNNANFIIYTKDLKKRKSRPAED